MSYHTWNIGFVERNIEDIILSKDNEVKVNWVKHNYKNRFFADPFILSVDYKFIRVLVEDYPYYNKKGIISLLTIDRNTYKLLDRKEILKQPFHMSYPFIQRNDDGSVKWVAPEASMSGKLFRYSINNETNMLENQQVLFSEPLLDSTIIRYNGLYWLFCTKRGINSNSHLYIYYSKSSEGPWNSHKNNPVVENYSMARPAGYIIKANDSLYRVIQKCNNYYGESIMVSKINVLNELEFQESFVKEIRASKDIYSKCFHTINGFGNLCVVDGVKVDYRPFRRLLFEFINFFNLKR